MAYFLFMKVFKSQKTDPANKASFYLIRKRESCKKPGFQLYMTASRQNTSYYLACNNFTLKIVF